MPRNLFSGQLLDVAEYRAKQAFIDPNAAAGMPPAGGAPMDPAMAGMDPAMAGGAGGMPMDPAMMGGAPPMDPAMAGGGGMPPGPDIQTMITQAVQTAMGGAGGGAAGGAMGGGAGIKPKIDVNVVMLQILKILARIADALGVQIPASEMVAGPADLGQLASQSQGGAPAGGGAGGSAIQPIQPMQGASPQMAGGKTASWSDIWTRNSLEDSANALALMMDRQ